MIGQSRCVMRLTTQYKSRVQSPFFGLVMSERIFDFTGGTTSALRSSMPWASIRSTAGNSPFEKGLENYRVIRENAINSRASHSL